MKPTTLVLVGLLGIAAGVIFGIFLGIERVHVTILMCVGFGVLAWIFTYLFLKINQSGS